MWYQIVSAIVNVGLAWQDQYLSNRMNKKMYRAAAKTAEMKAKMADANLSRRSAYRNEELGQQVWNISEQAQELIGAQRSSMAGSGFDVSTGDQRILTDTLRRNLEDQKGMNRTYYLQQFEDDLQTRSDILQYNFEAYANRQMVKYYSGIHGLAKIIDAGGRAFVNSASSNLFANPKGGVSDNTGFGKAKGWESVSGAGKDLAMQRRIDSTFSFSALGGFSNLSNSKELYQQGLKYSNLSNFSF